MKIAGTQFIGRKHQHKGKHQCIAPTLINTTNGIHVFHELRNNKAIHFSSDQGWFWLPTAGFYGLFSIRTVDLAFTDFLDFTDFDDDVIANFNYLRGM